MEFNREQLVEMLQQGVIRVTFEKVDGSTRVMDCTLKSEFLPEEYQNKAPMLTEERGNTLAVWDTGVSQWRSFRIASVKSVSI
jgi:hypothetical protein